MKYKVIATAGDSFYNAITLVDLSLPDQPLVYVNQEFCRLTGYPAAEIIGKNCRFLQGENTAREDRSRIHRAIAQQDAVFCDLLNYRKNGEVFYNRLVLVPIAIENIPHFIGMQIDATPLIREQFEYSPNFDAIKGSELIKDRIKNPLMTIFSVISIDKPALVKKEILTRAFNDILTTVKNIPFILHQ
jgi:PAS domain S-box-containing protein